MKKIFLSILFIFCILSAYSQDINLPKSQIPPSPTSSVFRQYTGYTPSLATGSVSIDIPLYDIHIGNLYLPFHLQYYTNGIKLGDIPYPVGYGWSFNPGLRVTRTVIGSPEIVKGMYPTSYNYREFMAKNYSDLVSDENYHEKFMYLRGVINRDPLDYNIDQISGKYYKKYDTEHDIFTVHLPSGNYHFILSDGNIFTFGNLIDIKPITTLSQLIGFIIKDEKGIEFHFGQNIENQNSTEYCEFPYENPNLYTTWLLREIKFPDTSHIISFSWGETECTPLTNMAYKASSIFYDKFEYDLFNKQDSPYYPYNNPSSNINYNVNYKKVKMLKSINYPSGDIILTYADFGKKPTLSSMEVLNKKKEVIKNIIFSYDSNNTLLLTNVRLSDEGEYKLEYNDNRFNSLVAQDYWGYYNGKDFNDGLAPRFNVHCFRYQNSITPIETIIGTSDRRIDEEYMKANILIKT